MKENLENSSRWLAAVNAMSQEQFAGLLARIFEDTPAVAGEAWSRRPFRSGEELWQAMCEVVRRWPPERVVELIRAHPDLVGRLAQEGRISPESLREQAEAGLDALTPEEAAQFEAWNADYRAKFGFPFVICARLNRKEAILEAFPRRLACSREDEIRAAVEEIFQIARLRIEELIQ